MPLPMSKSERMGIIAAKRLTKHGNTAAELARRVAWMIAGKPSIVIDTVGGFQLSRLLHVNDDGDKYFKDFVGDVVLNDDGTARDAIYVKRWTWAEWCKPAAAQPEERISFRPEPPDIEPEAKAIRQIAEGNNVIKIDELQADIRRERDAHI